MSARERKSGSQHTRGWSEPDSNPRSPGREKGSDSWCEPDSSMPEARVRDVASPTGDRWFESISLQGRVCELSVPKGLTATVGLCRPNEPDDHHNRRPEGSPAPPPTRTGTPAPTRIGCAQPSPTSCCTRGAARCGGVLHHHAGRDRAWRIKQAVRRKDRILPASPQQES